MKIWNLAVIGTMLFVGTLCSNQEILHKSAEFKDCLVNRWGIDERSAWVIATLAAPIINDANKHAVIDDFIKMSSKIALHQKPATLQPIAELDGVVRAPKQHIIVFENPWIRVLWGSTMPGEKEAMHTHHWPRILLIVKPTMYEIHHNDGRVEVGDWPAGAYELPADESYACTNVGRHADECLSFEIKE